MTLELAQAVKIAKILSQAPEERIPLILSVLEKANLPLEGLEELTECSALKNQARLIDIRDFLAELRAAFPADGGRLCIPVKEFGDFCLDRKLKPLLVKVDLARHGYLEPTYEGPKRGYSVTKWRDGKAVRCVELILEPTRTIAENG